MVLGRKVSPEVAERYAADQELAAGLRDRLEAAQEAERELRAAQVAGRPADEQRTLATAYDAALKAAIDTAEAATRVEMGTATYPHGDAKEHRAAEIATRKAHAKPGVKPYLHEADRLRTLREQHKLSFRTAPTPAR